MNQRPSQKDLDRGLDGFRRRALRVCCDSAVNCRGRRKPVRSFCPTLTPDASCDDEAAATRTGDCPLGPDGPDNVCRPQRFYAGANAAAGQVRQPEGQPSARLRGHTHALTTRVDSAGV